LKLVRGEAPSFTVTAENLEEFAGKAKFSSERLYQNPVPGVVMGLAWTPYGGTTLYIECVAERTHLPVAAGVEKTEIVSSEKEGGKEDRGSLFCTGQLGDVMSESSRVAYTVAKAQYALINPRSRFFEHANIHMHIPEGATPKDGPSAGITMVTALVSLALNKPIRNLSMTGEITLTGKVLPIDGVKEKIIAARRSRVYEIILPKNNKKEIEALPQFIKEGVLFHFVEEIKEALDIAFGPEPKNRPVVPADTD